MPVSSLRTSESRFRRLIDATAEFIGLPPWEIHGERFLPGEVLEALILQESGGRPEARRYEPHHDTAARRDAASDGDTFDHDDGPLEDDASYGLIQVLGSNVRRLVGAPPGTPMDFGFLLRPLAGLAFGLRVLLIELDATDESWARALARYNGGPTGEVMTATGAMRRQEYVDDVEAKCHVVRVDRRENDWRYPVGP